MRAMRLSSIPVTTDRPESGRSHNHSFPYPPSSLSSSTSLGNETDQHNPIIFEQLTAEKVNFTQKTAPLVPVPYTSISKFCRPSKESYQTCKIFLI